MLKQENRLKKRKEFNYIYKKGKSISTKSLTLYYVSSNHKHPKIGFSIGKKIGKAYVRNKIKRQLRAIVKENLGAFDKKYNFVFIARQNINNLVYLSMKEELIYLLNKANLYIKEGK